MRELRLRARSRLRRRRVDGEFEEELRFHLDLPRRFVERLANRPGMRELLNDDT